MTKPENPPAYPVVWPMGNPDTGMTLRDAVAIAALPWALSLDYGNDFGKNGKGHIPKAVSRAFAIAGAFLVEREKSDG